MKDLDKIPQKNTELAWRVIDNEVVIIPLDEQTSNSKKIIFLNESGTIVWEMVNGKNKIKDIIEKIIKEYDVSQKEAEEEVINFINKLRKNNLIRT